MRLVHCLLLVCTLLTLGGSQSDQGCETFDGYDIDPKKDYHYIGTAAGEDEAKCCAYCIANLTGCTAYVFVARDNMCYFKNITDLHKKMTPSGICKAGILRQTTTMRSSHRSFTSSEFIRQEHTSESPEMNETMVLVGVMMLVVCMMLVAMGFAILSCRIRKKRMKLILSPNDDGNETLSGLSPTKTTSVASGSVTAR